MAFLQLPQGIYPKTSDEIILLFLSAKKYVKKRTGGRGRRRGRMLRTDILAYRWLAKIRRHFKKRKETAMGKCYLLVPTIFIL